MNKKPVETIMGIVVLVVATLFMVFAYNVSDLQVVKGYEIGARFLKVGGLNTGADVRINGVKIGTAPGVIVVDDLPGSIFINLSPIKPSPAIEITLSIGNAISGEILIFTSTI